MARTAARSGQKVRKTRGATQPPGRYELLKATRAKILAARVFKQAKAIAKAKNARSPRKVRTAKEVKKVKKERSPRKVRTAKEIKKERSPRQATSDEDSDNDIAPVTADSDNDIAPVTAEKHLKKNKNKFNLETCDTRRN